MKLTSVEIALDLILKDANVIGSEQVQLSAANSRYLAEDIKALRTHPPFDTSAMDGFAAKSSDLNSTPTNLTVIGEVAAGHYFDGEVSTGEVVRIFTGAPIPNGTDCVIIQENTKQTGNNIVVTERVEKGTFIRATGLDFITGDILLNKGTMLNFRSVSLAASMNHPTLPVYKKPIVGILSTGDELVEPGNSTKTGQIISTNKYGVASFVQQHGGDSIDFGIAKDNSKDIAEKLEDALDSNINILVTIGGASVGKHDLIRPALSAKGWDPQFWRIAMRPGKPLLFGKFNDKYILGLPGNPVSSLICSIVFLRPLLLTMLGQNSEQKIEWLRTKEHLPANDQRQDYLRAKIIHMPNGERFVKAFNTQDSSMLAVLTESDCLIVRPPFASAENPNSLVQTIPI